MPDGPANRRLFAFSSSTAGSATATATTLVLGSRGEV
jgi:hypothetical protein